MTDEDIGVRLTRLWLEQYPAKAGRRAELILQAKQKGSSPGQAAKLRRLEEWLNLLEQALQALPPEEETVLREAWLSGRAFPGDMALGQKLFMDPFTVRRYREAGLRHLAKALFG